MAQQGRNFPATLEDDDTKVGFSKTTTRREKIRGLALGLTSDGGGERRSFWGLVAHWHGRR
jgi:hypothetical protein